MQRLSKRYTFFSSELVVLTLAARYRRFITGARSIVRTARHGIGRFLLAPTYVPRQQLDEHGRHLSTERKYMQPEAQTVVVVEQTCAFARARLLQNDTRRVNDCAVDHWRRKRCTH